MSQHIHEERGTIWSAHHTLQTIGRLHRTWLEDFKGYRQAFDLVLRLHGHTNRPHKERPDCRA